MEETNCNKKATEFKVIPGQAHIKVEFMVKTDPHVRAVVKDASEENGTKNIQEANGSESPPAKKKKRGQNKKRPRNKQLDFGIRLCPSLVNSTGICAFKGNCKFVHDVNNYVENKKSDIGPHCYAFDTFGSCPYGITCRFGSSHIAKNKEGKFESIICESKSKDNTFPVVQNNLNHSLRMKLRKNFVCYAKSDVVLSEMNIDNKYSKKNALPQSTCEEIGNESKKLKTDIGMVVDMDKTTVDFKSKLILAPLTTCGNLPFRVICKQFGADITCGEMAMATALLQGSTSEWALVKRHPIENVYGVQICGAFADSMAKCTELLSEVLDVDFIDINMGCPIDLVYKKGGGSGLMRRQNKLTQIVKSMVSVSKIPITCKMRTGVEKSHNTAHVVLENLKSSGIAMAAIHGRSREARYTKDANWDYISDCVAAADPLPLYGNGDIYSYADYEKAMTTGVSGAMIARGALIKPWIFNEIKEKKVWDISSNERLDIVQNYVNEGLLHWGSDTKGVETTRRFLLEWLSFLYRYIPVGILEQPQRINERPPYYVGRNDLETLFASPNCDDWVKISEMFLNKVPEDFKFLPKHKAHSYSN